MTHKSPLHDCLQFILNFYSVRADLDGLLSQAALKDGQLTPQDIPVIVHKTGLKAETQTIPTNRISKNEAPSIVTIDGHDPFVLLPQKTHAGKVYKPQQGLADIPVESLKNLDSVTIISITPESFSTDAATDHMVKGHALDWFWTPIFKFWPHYSEVLLASVFINIFVLILPLYTLNIYDRVIPNDAQSTLIVLTIGVLIAIGFDLILKTTRNYILEHIAGKIGVQYDFDLMERMMLIKDQNMPLSTGEKVNIFRELQGMRDFYAAKLAPTIVDLPFFLLFLGVIYIINPALTIVPVIGAIVIFILNMSIRVFIGRLSEKYFSSMQKKSTSLVETLSGTKTFKMFNGVGSRLFHWNAVVSGATDRARYNQFITSTVSNLSVTTMHVVHIFVVVVGVYEIQAGNLTIGGLIACSILSSRAMGPVMSLSAVVGQLRQSYDVLKTIDRLFKLPHEGQDTSDKSAKGPFKGCIELHDVTFAYPKQQRAALQNITLTINPGESIGLIGKTGAGKSTLASMVSGFLDCQQGRINMDNFALSSISPPELRSIIGIVPQNPFFFSGTLLENILVGRDQYEKAALDQALYISGMDLVIKDSGYGLDMQVSENGENLSGGQRQSIALARAVLHDPQILIFDEPTTGMDQALEARVKSSLADYIKNRTFIMITHRTTLLPLVDRLILMDQGRVLADGARDDILHKLSGGGTQ